MSLKKIFVNISCVYVEKGITFKISHKVYKLIMGGDSKSMMK